MTLHTQGISLPPCCFARETYWKCYLELFLQSCLSSRSWYEDTVNITMQLTGRYFSLLSKNGFQQGIVDENVLLLKGTRHGSHWGELRQGSHLCPLREIDLRWTLPLAGTSLMHLQPGGSAPVHPSLSIRSYFRVGPVLRLVLYSIPRPKQSSGKTCVQWRASEPLPRIYLSG